MKIYEVTDPLFRAYGKVIKNLDVAPLVEAMMQTPCPENGTIYVASDPALEALPVATEIQRVAYGEVPIQIGYCNGHNIYLNALEYHRCSEINIACGADAILLLGKQTDLDENYGLDTDSVVAFRIPEGVPVEVYATTLHYAPCNAGEAGFRCVVVLSRGTNEALDTPHAAVADNAGEVNEDSLLTAKNKWLIVHPEGGQAAGTYPGLRGENLHV